MRTQEQVLEARGLSIKSANGAKKNTGEESRNKKGVPVRTKIRPVILSGGLGTRLWPLSRRRFPKQFVSLIGESCLFETTLRAITDREIFEAPLIVGNIEHKFFILDILEKLKIADAVLLLEPESRNTAASAIVAALMDAGNGVLHLVLPSDQVITDRDDFNQFVLSAAPAARAGNFVLFGITPRYPETGYGYIVADGTTEWPAARKVATFWEKPDREMAAALIARGALWNSGIFLYAPSALNEEAAALAPAHFELCRKALLNARPDTNGLLLMPEAYASMENHAFDNLILEPTTRGLVVPCDVNWNDIGSWHSLWQLSQKDGQGNVLKGPVIAEDTRNAYIRSEGPTIAAIGLTDLAIIATKDTVLIAPRARSQEIKKLTKLIAQVRPEGVLDHICVRRPWGSYESIAEGAQFQVKHIIVRPGQSLSLQMHHHRAEHWVIVAGAAQVECNGEEKLIFPNQTVFVPQGAKHRLSNPGRMDLHLIEIQTGDYFGEDDIIRFSDRYGRTGKNSRPGKTSTQM